ncbi:MAG: extracellular solute-binding protein, partial [Bifidobacteriaceae bacterium]|nr:extracellular solute-binding protein [Bifidobacteriaceae bacterium]
MLLTPRKTAAAVAAALLAGLAGCGQADQDNPAPSGGGEVTADNPFGVEEGSSVEAIVFDGGYGVEWVAFAGDMVEAKVGATVDVSGSTEIAQEVQPRFVGGNPPDFLDNTGSASIPPVSIIDQVVPMDELWGTANYDGIAIGDAVLPIAKQVGTVNGKFIQVPYVMTLFALWYSQSLFDENGWTPPETWDQMMNLCVEAKAQDKYLFTWGKEAANYWEWLVLDLALKEGGRDVWLNIANLQPGAWDQPAVVAAMDAVEDSVNQGCWIPGG